MMQLVISIALALVQHGPEMLRLIVALVHEVHDAEAQLPGQPGADKSARVLEKVTPIVEEVGVDAPKVQVLIDGIVAQAKSLGYGAFAASDAGAGG